MSVDLRSATADYLTERRARGYRLADHGWLLAAFLDGLEASGAVGICLADALAFAQARPLTGRQWQAARLHAVRGLASYVHTLDPTAAELIPAGLIPAKVTRSIPYLYSDDQIATLMSRTKALSPPPLLAASIHTLIGLLATTGLRSAEAVRLDVEDLSVDQRVLTVVGKYGRQRLVPLHPTTVEALLDYQQLRATRAAPAGARGGRLNLNQARAAFRGVVNSCNLPTRPGCRRPRLHDFRHTFAVNSLIDAHRQGADVDARVAVLATYLGHVDPINTYWYYSDSRVIPIPAPLPA